VEAAREPMTGTPGLARRLGPFDATMLVMGGIVGSGIFMNPSVVARHVRTPFLILAAWLLGGLIALAGAFVYRELAARFSDAGGQYVYLREAYHPMVAFLYGWCLLLVVQTGGMAAVAVTFARYLGEIVPLPLSESVVAVLALALLTVVNCLGARTGSSVQGALMSMKIVVIAVLVIAGLTVIAPSAARPALLDRPVSLDLLAAFGAAMTPVLFAYGGWQTASFVAGEMRDPARDLGRGLLFGVIGVIVLYTGVSWISVRALGAEGLAATTAPASAVMHAALGEWGARVIAFGIVLSTLGFLSQSMLTAPRVYFAMARDGVFLRPAAWVHPRTAAPVVAIALQGLAAALIALSGRYEQILSYVVSVDFLWFGLTGATLFVLRQRGARRPEHATPGHPGTTIFFIACCFGVVAATIRAYPAQGAGGLAILATGVPVYFLWRRRS